MKQAKKPIGKTRHRAYKGPETGYYEGRSALPLYKWALFLMLGLWGGLPHVLAYAGQENQAPDKVLVLVDSIYKAEGGEKASVPYGLIYSGWCKQEPGWCRYYASEIVSIKYAQWVRHGRPGEFIDYLGASYCPPSAHPLNANWTRNVKRFYKASSGQAQFEMETEPVSAVRG